MAPSVCISASVKTAALVTRLTVDVPALPAGPAASVNSVRKQTGSL